EQLIRPLRKAGFVTSSRGPRGGYAFAKDPSHITIGDIVRMFEGQSDLVDCVGTPHACAKAGECRVRLVWQEATAALFEKLDGVSIADLMCLPQAHASKES
ncbi:MAG: Rrf2 family transcriptional regulator, partial [Desulfatitalea sp.]|nr:Rrf2 family transcriptional regulator [Desulfatitalea sp.]